MSEPPLQWLLGLEQFGIKFGLDNIRAIVSALDHPERAFDAVHVAGTNGKGSVTAITEAALRTAGVRTGRYTSPHLLHLAERFAVDGVPVSPAVLEGGVATVRRVVASLQARDVLEVHPTFFEVTTAVAFELFRASGVQVAVCEVGLGGRLDATNVLQPLACAITSIGLDHQHYLGHTLREIALEKAGVVKAGVPVVAGRMDPSAASAITERAAELAAPLVWAWDGVACDGRRPDPAGGQRFRLVTPACDYGEVRLALDGSHQIDNAVVAVRLLEELGARGVPVDARHIVLALAKVSWPGRLQRIPLGIERDVLVDAAHNEAGAAALAGYLRSLGPPRPLVFAAMRDKDAGAMLRALLPAVGAVIVTRATNPRSSEPAALTEQIARIDRGRVVEVCGAVPDALTAAWRHGPQIVAAGSIFLVADVLKALGRS